MVNRHFYYDGKFSVRLRIFYHFSFLILLFGRSDILRCCFGREIESKSVVLWFRRHDVSTKFRFLSFEIYNRYSATGLSCNCSDKMKKEMVLIRRVSFSFCVFFSLCYYCNGDVLSSIDLCLIIAFCGSCVMWKWWLICYTILRVQLFRIIWAFIRSSSTPSKGVMNHNMRKNKCCISTILGNSEAVLQFDLKNELVVSDLGEVLNRAHIGKLVYLSNTTRFFLLRCYVLY